MTAIEIIKDTIDNMFPLAGATMDWTLHKQINAAIIDALIDYDSPAGVPIPALRDNVPDGYHLFDRGLLNIADCPKLYAIWGTRFNLGDEASGTFRCPPCAPGTVFVQAGVSGYNDVNLGLFSIGGEIKHALTADENGEHEHLIDGMTGGDNSDHNATNRLAAGDKAPESSSFYFDSQACQPSGKGDAHNNMQPYMAVNYMFRLC